MVEKQTGKTRLESSIDQPSNAKKSSNAIFDKWIVAYYNLNKLR